MTLRTTASPVALAAFASLSLFASSAAGAPASKEECIDAHSRGQDLREKGQLARAKQTFMTCAQSSCPSLIQSDCARFGDELTHLVPTVTFGARDGAGSDLPNTSVFVDDLLLATRLDDGKAHELDPGKHTVRYVHDGKETTLRVVLNQGEKGRLLLASFVDAEAARDAAHRDALDVTSPPPTSHRSIFPLVVAGLGAAAAATGGVLFQVGLAQVPDNCSIATKECAGRASDASFEEARSGTSLANVGIGVGIAGATMLVGGLVWYFVQPTGSSDSRRGAAPGPWLTF